MSETWSGVLYIDFEVGNSPTAASQGVVLKLLVAGQIQHGMTDMNETYRRTPHSVSYRKNVQFEMINDQNPIRWVENTFTNRPIT